MSNAEQSVIRDAKGVVKWFDARKGFGFIIGPAGQDIFAHYTVIEGSGFRILKDGWVVAYDAEFTSTGWRAVRIVLPDGALTELPNQRRPALGPKPAPPPGKPPHVVVRSRKRPGAANADDSPPLPPPSSRS